MPANDRRHISCRFRIALAATGYRAPASPPQRRRSQKEAIMSRPVILAAFAVSLASSAAAVPLIPLSQETATGASVSIAGIANISQSDSEDSEAVANAPATHVQAAGRSRPGTPPVIAANGSFANADFLERAIRAQGTARQQIRLLAPSGRLTMHIELPQLLLELTDNGERFGPGGVPFGGDLLASLDVSICVQGPGIPAGTCLLSLTASLTGYLQHEQLTINVSSSDPALDLSAFNGQSPAIVADIASATQTATWDFPGFEGDIDLSAFGGREITILYDVLAIADGYAAGTAAAAGFNDPFLFEADPTGGSPITFDFTPTVPSAVPGPGGLGLLVLAAGGLVAIRRSSTPPPAPSGRCGRRSRG
jgi:hypothetical protein